MTETIELKLTWAYAMEIYMACLENGTEQGKQAAREELRTLARQMDALIDAKGSK